VQQTILVNLNRQPYLQTLFEQEPCRQQVGIEQPETLMSPPRTVQLWTAPGHEAPPFWKHVDERRRMTVILVLMLLAGFGLSVLAERMEGK
jgi:hypothetical protein